MPARYCLPNLLSPHAHTYEIPQDHSFVRAPVVLHTISSFEQPILEQAAGSILKGLAVCIRKTGPLRNEITNTPDFWSLLQSLHGNQEVAASVFGLIENTVAGQPPTVTADNYEPTVRLLNSFAMSGSVGAVIEQKRDKNARGPKNTKSARPRYA